jgi:hypothetical protein
VLLTWRCMQSVSLLPVCMYVLYGLCTKCRNRIRLIINNYSFAEWWREGMYCLSWGVGRDCMYVCVYVCVYLCMYVWIYVRLCISIYIQYVNAHFYRNELRHTFTYVRMCECCIYVCTIFISRYIWLLFLYPYSWSHMRIWKKYKPFMIHLYSAPAASRTFGAHFLARERFILHVLSIDTSLNVFYNNNFV